jgi:hypothetical protein
MYRNAFVFLKSLQSAYLVLFVPFPYSYIKNCQSIFLFSMLMNCAMENKGKFRYKVDSQIPDYPSVSLASQTYPNGLSGWANILAKIGNPHFAQSAKSSLIFYYAT